MVVASELTTGSIGSATSTTNPKSTLLKTWEALYPTVTRPLFVNFAGCHQFAMHAGVIATAGTAGTKTAVLDATPDASSCATTAQIATNDFFKGMWLCVTLGGGIGQAYEIASYVGSTRTVTLVDSIVTTIPNTANYRIVARPEYVFADVAVEYMSSLIFKNVPTDAVAQQAIIKLIDNEGTLQQNGVSKCDWNYLMDFVAKGKAYFQIVNVASL